MMLARVDGVVLSTVCHRSMRGSRMVICQPLDERGRDEGQPVLAIDPYGAGEHQHVVVSTDGGAARAFVKDPKSPLRNIVIAVANGSGLAAQP
jgi:microcompartment protein CcmK/EutM